MTETQTRAGLPVLDFDHHSPEISEHRENVLAMVRPHPMFWTESYGGYWVVTGHELAKQVLHDREHFSTARTPDGGGGITIPPLPVVLVPAEIDPPEHTAIRQVLNPMLGKAATDKLRPMMERVAVELLDAAISARDFDIVHDLAHAFPATITLRYLGIPEAEGKFLMTVIQSGFGTAKDLEDPAVAAAAQQAFGEMQRLIHGLLEERRATPQDDVMSELVKHDFDPDQLFWIVLTFIAAGTENVAALIANTMLYLAQNPDVKQRLLDSPELLPNAVEEFLRFFTPGPSTVRHVTRDVTVNGIDLEPGDRVLVWLPGANFDPTAFPDPDTVDIERPGVRRHVAFGEGVHFCAGHILGKVELEVFLRAQLQRMPDYRIDLESSQRFDNPATMYGWWSMPASVR